jgi:hypothetical protein
MSLDTKDIELIERVLYKNTDEINISIGRSFERLEERIDAIEARLYTRFNSLEERVEEDRTSMRDTITDMCREVELLRETINPV